MFLSVINEEVILEDKSLDKACRNRMKQLFYKFLVQFVWKVDFYGGNFQVLLENWLKILFERTRSFGKFTTLQTVQN
jgi:hypothetical protein